MPPVLIELIVPISVLAASSQQQCAARRIAGELEYIKDLGDKSSSIAVGPESHSGASGSGNNKELLMWVRHFGNV